MKTAEEAVYFTRAGGSMEPVQPGGRQCRPGPVLSWMRRTENGEAITLNNDDKTTPFLAQSLGDGR